jgi:hypothetical protein
MLRNESCNEPECYPSKKRVFLSVRKKKKKKSVFNPKKKEKRKSVVENQKGTINLVCI